MRNASASATSRKAQTAKRTNKELRCFKPNRSDELLVQIDRQVTQLLKATLELRKRDEGIETLRGMYLASVNRNVKLVAAINAVLAEGAAELNGVRWIRAEKIQEAIGQ